MRMQNVVEAVKKYILESLGLQIDPLLWKEGDNLPGFLKDRYTLYAASILDKSYLLAVAEASEEASPAQIAKHMAQIEGIAGLSCIYVSEKLPAYNRQRLVLHRVPFVIPKSQLYLPDLGIDCRKTFSKRISRSSGLIPSSQTVVIYDLVQGFSDCITPSELALNLHYTRMTMTRALNELEERGLGETFRRGKERFFHFPQNKKVLWERAMEFMQSPVKESVWIQISNEIFDKIKGLGFMAGLTALAGQTMLNPPPYQTFALSHVVWKVLLKSGNIRILPISEGATVQLEIWHYDPALFSKGGIVDPFSLYLSLQKTNDERIEQALEELMEKVEW